MVRKLFLRKVFNKPRIHSIYPTKVLCAIQDGFDAIVYVNIFIDTRD